LHERAKGKKLTRTLASTASKALRNPASASELSCSVSCEE
jgi:hypothetical protein